MLFVDAESFLSDARWWAAKQQLVTRAESRGQRGSALLSQRHTVHHSFSDVLVVGGRAFELLRVLRKHRTGLKRGGVADETSGGARADVPPSPEALLSETNRLILDFARAHLLSVTSVGVTRDWVAPMLVRTQEENAYRVLAGGAKLGLPVDDKCQAQQSRL
jgi:hypothetical protein